MVKTKINKKIWENLLNATEQLQSADSNGTTRGIIIDAYFCIDSCWSALIYSRKKSHPRNHKQKLDLAFPFIADNLYSKNITYNKVVSFYKLWLETRYSQKNISPNDAYKQKLMAHSIYSLTISSIAEIAKIKIPELKKELSINLLGGHYETYREIIGFLHENYQHTLEMAGELGNGSKLGNKIINPSNYCMLSLVSNDKITREILSQEDSIHKEIAVFYDTFIKLVLKIEKLRFEKGVPINDISDHSLGLKVRYSGGTLEEMTERWAKIFKEIFHEIK
jgi:hypothetical protein